MSISEHLNQAITRFNLARHAGNELHMHYWHSKAKSFAARADTRIVPMPERPGAIIAAAFLPLVTD